METQNKVGSAKDMSKETAMKHLTGMYGQTYAGVKLMIYGMKGAKIARVLEIYSGLPFVKPCKAVQDEQERTLLQGLIKLGDLRSSMLECLNETGEIKADDASLDKVEE